MGQGTNEEAATRVEENAKVTRTIIRLKSLFRVRALLNWNVEPTKEGKEGL